jgi:hypothetical protein
MMSALCGSTEQSRARRSTLFPVTFCSGSTVLGVETLDGNGEARLTFSWKNAGSYKIKAVYSGDSNFEPITSSVMTETVT